MRNTTINTTNGTALNRLANVIVVGVTATLRDLVELFARGAAASARYGAVLAGRQPAGQSWQPVMCPACCMPARSQRHHRRRASGIAVKRGTVGIG